MLPEINPYHFRTLFFQFIFSTRPRFRPYSAWKSNITAKTRSTSAQHAYLRKRSEYLLTYINHDPPDPRADSPIVRSHIIAVSWTIPTHILVILLNHNIRINSNNNNWIPDPSGRAV